VRPVPTFESVRGALLRFRVMAFVVGVTLLAFCAAIIWKYALDGPDDNLVAQLHGFLFMIYALLCLDLGFRMRWGLGRLFFMVIAGMIPFLSFVAEVKVSRWVTEETAAAHPEPEPTDPGGSSAVA